MVLWVGFCAAASCHPAFFGYAVASLREAPSSAKTRGGRACRFSPRTLTVRSGCAHTPPQQSPNPRRASAAWGARTVAAPDPRKQKAWRRAKRVDPAFPRRASWQAVSHDPIPYNSGSRFNRVSTSMSHPSGSVSDIGYDSLSLGKEPSSMSRRRLPSAPRMTSARSA